MTLSTVMRVVLVCEIVAARFIGIPSNYTPGNWGIWYNHRQPDPRTQFLPHPPRYVHLPQVNPGFLNNQGPNTAHRHVTHLQQTIVLANNLHIQNPSALNNTGSGNEHMRLHNKVYLASNRSLTHRNIQQESNALLQNRNLNQSSHTENRPFAGVDQKWSPDNIASQTPGVPQRRSEQIHISFHGVSNSLPSNISDRHQAAVDDRSSPGRIFVKSRGTVNISHPRGIIEISKSPNGRSNIIIKTNTKDTNGTPQRKLPTELSNITQTTYISDVGSMITTQYESTTEEIEHEAP